MYRIVTAFITLIFCLLVMFGCSTPLSVYTRGNSYLKSGDYDRAIEEFREVLNKKPGDPVVLFSIGLAYYNKGDYENAVLYLGSAKEANPKSLDAHFYLGLAYEGQGRYDMAIMEYDDCIRLKPKRNIAKRLESRKIFLTREISKASAKRALEVEAELASNIGSIPENTVAVTDFTHVGALKQLEPLGKGLAGMLITDLSKANAITVVERMRIQDVLKEIKMEGVDKETAVRPGLLLGASKIITGSYTSLDGTSIDIVSSITMTKLKTSRPSKGVSGLMQKLFDLEKDLAFGILEDLGVVLSEEERNAIRKVQTRSFEAFLAYSRGLDFVDRGLYQEASREFKQAIQIDPNFAAPKIELKTIDSLMLETKGINSFQSLPVQAQQEALKEERVSTVDRYITGTLFPLPGTHPKTYMPAIPRGGGSSGVLPTMRNVNIEVIIPER